MSLPVTQGVAGSSPVHTANGADNKHLTKFTYKITYVSKDLLFKSVGFFMFIPLYYTHIAKQKNHLNN